MLTAICPVDENKFILITTIAGAATIKQMTVTILYNVTFQKKPYFNTSYEQLYSILKNFISTNSHLEKERNKLFVIGYSLLISYTP